MGDQQLPRRHALQSFSHWGKDEAAPPFANTCMTMVLDQMTTYQYIRALLDGYKAVKNELTLRQKVEFWKTLGLNDIEALMVINGDGHVNYNCEFVPEPEKA